jgi:hypothetical protein
VLFDGFILGIALFIVEYIIDGFLEVKKRRNWHNTAEGRAKALSISYMDIPLLQGNIGLYIF